MACAYSIVRRAASLLPKLVSNCSPNCSQRSAGFDHAVEAVNGFRSAPAGRLRLLVHRQAAMVIIVPLMPQFLREYPEIRLEIVADDADHDIINGHFDAGVRLGERIEKDMITMRLFDAYWMVAVAAPAYLRRPSDADGAGRPSRA